jgi:hypothetical protein
MRCEGFGAFVLKRTADAVDAGDRILAEVLSCRWFHRREFDTLIALLPGLLWPWIG